MKSALVKVHDDSLRPLGNQNSVILLLLDPSTASDTVDYNWYPAVAFETKTWNQWYCSWLVQVLYFQQDLHCHCSGWSIYWATFHDRYTTRVCTGAYIILNVHILHLLEMSLVYMTWVTIFMRMTPSSMSLLKQLVLTERGEIPHRSLHKWCWLMDGLQ